MLAQWEGQCYKNLSRKTDKTKIAARQVLNTVNGGKG